MVILQILQILHGKVLEIKTHAYHTEVFHRGTGKAIQIALGKHDHLTGPSEKVLEKSKQVTETVVLQVVISTPFGVDERLLALWIISH